MSNLVYGLTVGACFGAGIGFLLWADVALGESRSGTPAGSLRADRDSGLLRLAGGVCVVGLLFGMAIWQTAWDDDLVVGALLWVAVTLCLGMFSGRRAWLAYTVMVVYTACHRDLPLRLMRFLDDAHRLGLLRAVGPSYQFRHAEFQDHLTARRPVPEPTGTPRPDDTGLNWWQRNWPFVVGGLVGLTFAALWDSPVGPGPRLTGWRDDFFYFLTGAALTALMALAMKWRDRRRSRARRP
ncbi:hypothetical protein [Streptomyces caeruleatus]|nr:hypothetical protein [Streptomyces caeruleatus]